MAPSARECRGAEDRRLRDSPMRHVRLALALVLLVHGVACDAGYRPDLAPHGEWDVALCLDPPVESLLRAMGARGHAWRLRCARETAVRLQVRVDDVVMATIGGDVEAGSDLWFAWMAQALNPSPIGMNEPADQGDRTPSEPLKEAISLCFAASVAGGRGGIRVESAAHEFERTGWMMEYTPPDWEPPRVSVGVCGPIAVSSSRGKLRCLAEVNVVPGPAPLVELAPGWVCVSRVTWTSQRGDPHRQVWELWLSVGPGSQELR